MWGHFPIVQMLIDRLPECFCMGQNLCLEPVLLVATTSMRRDAALASYINRIQRSGIKTLQDLKLISWNEKKKISRLPTFKASPQDPVGLPWQSRGSDPESPESHIEVLCGKKIE